MIRLSLAAARTNAGYAQKEAAKLLGVSPKTLGNWEKGLSFPKIDQVAKICDLYGVPYELLNFSPTDSL